MDENCKRGGELLAKEVGSMLKYIKNTGKVCIFPGNGR